MKRFSLLLFTALLIGCGSSEYKEGHAEGEKAADEMADKLDATKGKMSELAIGMADKLITEMDLNKIRSDENSKKSEKWIEGFQDGMKEKWKTRKAELDKEMSN